MWLSPCDIWLEEALTCQTFHAAESCHANLLARARVAILFDRIIVFHSLAPAPSPHRRVSGSVSVRRGITPTSSHNLLTVYSRFKAHIWLFLLWLQVQGDWLHFDHEHMLVGVWLTSQWLIYSKPFGALKIWFSESGLWCQLIQVLWDYPGKKKVSLFSVVV